MGIGMRKQSNTRKNTGTRPKSSEKKGRETESNPEIVRLNKAIADAGLASRRRADELIREGKVTVNRKVCTELGTKVGLDDVVAVNGEPISRTKHLTYVLLNKPKDIITTSHDEKGRKTIFDIVKIKQRLFSVGRLDRNTTGALLITNDGEMANRLMHPSYKVPRLYKAKLDSPLQPEHASQIARGVELEDGMTQPAELMIDPTDYDVVVIEIYEGRNREVRRLFEHFGYQVKRLDRKQYGVLTTRGLARGEYRHLTRQEIQSLRNLVKL
jgi:23S rRNA pseudouridine2605 synthase